MLKKYKFDKTAILNDLEQLPQKKKLTLLLVKLCERLEPKLLQL